MLNVINAQDDLYIKERGFKTFYKHSSNIPIYGIYEYDDYIHIIFSTFSLVLNKNTGSVVSSVATLDAFDLTGATGWPSDISFKNATSFTKAGDFLYFTTPNGVRVLRDKNSSQSILPGIEAPLLHGTYDALLNQNFRQYNWTASAVAPATNVTITIDTTPGWQRSTSGAISVIFARNSSGNYEPVLDKNSWTATVAGTNLTFQTGVGVPGPTALSGTMYVGYYRYFAFSKVLTPIVSDIPLVQITGGFGDCAADRGISYRAVLRRQFANGRFIESAPSPPVFAYNTMYGTVASGAKATWSSPASGTTITITAEDHLLRGGAIPGKVIGAVSGSVTYPQLEGRRVFNATSSSQLTFEADTALGSLTGTLYFQVDRASVMECILPPSAIAGDIIDLYFSETQVDLSESPTSVPDSDYYLAREITLTASDITRGFVFIDTSTSLFQKGIPLYTNPSDGDLSRKPNQLPPGANILESWKGVTFYAGIYQRHAVDLIITKVNDLSFAVNLQLWGAGSPEAFIIPSNSYSTGAIGIKTSAQILCRTINLNSNNFIAYYNNDIAESPGSITILSRIPNQGFNVWSSSSPVNFEPPIGPNNTNGLKSTQEIAKNRIYWSKANQPEAVPFYVDVGDTDKHILNIKRLKDAVIVIKEEGIYALYGEPSTGVMSVREIDSTINGISSTGVATLGNRVYAKTDHGVVAITESSTAIVSRKQIEPLVKGKDEDYTQDTIMYANEAERTLYMCTSVNPATNTRITYAYNFLTGSWSEISQLFDGGIVIDSNLPLGTPALNNNRFIILGDTVYRERKENTKLDWCNNEFAISVASVTNGGRTINFNAVTTVYPAGWALGTDNKPGATFSLFRVVSSSAGSVTLDRPSNIVASDSVYLFEPISSVIRTAPIDGGDSSVVKHLTKFVINTKYDALSMIDIEFRNDWFRNTTPIRWEKEEVRRGWGTGAWGRFPWGNAPNETLIYLTEPSQIVQTEMPLATQKSSFIQAEITHAVACEGMFIQQMSFEVRPSSNKAAR